MSDLKPCPFCGSEAIENTLNNIYETVYNVSCSGEYDSSCVGLTINYYSDYKEDSIKAWNKRVNNDSRDN